MFSHDKENEAQLNLENFLSEKRLIGPLVTWMPRMPYTPSISEVAQHLATYTLLDLGGSLER